MKYVVNTTESTHHLEGVAEISVNEISVCFLDNERSFLLLVSQSHFISAEKVQDGANT